MCQHSERAKTDVDGWLVPMPVICRNATQASLNFYTMLTLGKEGRRWGRGLASRSLAQQVDVGGDFGEK